MPRSLAGSVSGAPAGCAGRPSRPGSRWRSRKARASQYMAVLDRAPRDCGDSVARIETSPSSVVRSTLAGPASTSLPAATTAESNPTGAPTERLDSSAAVTFRHRRADAQFPLRPLSPTTLVILRGREVAGFWFMNSARISRYRPERKDPAGGSLDSSGGRRTSADEDPEAATSASTPSHEPHWWQYEWPGGFSVAHRRQVLVKAILPSCRLGPASQRRNMDGIRVEIRVFRPGTDRC